jgi:hypothetical protein
VNGADQGQLLSHWGACESNCPEDLNEDDVVDGADLGQLLLNVFTPGARFARQAFFEKGRLSCACF